MLTHSVDALLFDLGNVVIEIDFNRAFTHWATHARCEESLIRRSSARRLERDSDRRDARTIRFVGERGRTIPALCVHQFQS
jgi:hypothetical protein